MEFEEYQQFVYGLTQECFVKTDLNLNTEKDAFIATLEFRGARAVCVIDQKLRDRGFVQLNKIELVYQIELILES
jgi:hypothetical protein